MENQARDNKLEDHMAANKTPSKKEILEALSNKGIKNLEELIDAIMPETDETGGYIFMDMGSGSDAAGDYLDMVKKFRGHGPDGWKLPIVAGIHSLWGE